MKRFVFFTITILNIIGYSSNAQIITTIAGGFPGLISGDGGPATDARLLSACGVAIDKKGNIYISAWHLSFTSHSVRKIDPSGIINTFAGTTDTGYSGDGGAATLAKLCFPEHIATDKYGNVYIADRGNKRIRKVDTFGIITTFAGNGSSTISGYGGPATATGIGSCYGVYCDTADNVYISSSGRILKINSSGVITLIAGTGAGGGWWRWRTGHSCTA